MKKTLIISAIAFLLASCSDILDPLPNGHYTGDNVWEYPSMVKGFVDKAYTLLPTSYAATENMYLDCATDDAVATSTTNTMRRLALGTITQANDPFASFWSRDYEALFYLNTFLKDRAGYNTRFMVDGHLDTLVRRNYQGDAYALRAWFQLDLLKKFGGKGSNGQLLGYPIVTEPIDIFKADPNSFTRNTYDECVAQIIKDCDSALVYLPEANRDWLAENTTYQGAARWGRLDGISVKGIKAMTYLMWASPTFNPTNDLTRWEKAAEYAAELINFKLTVDATKGFTPKARFTWTDPNSNEIFWSSEYSKGSTMENLQYPNGFQGGGNIGPTQELVAAFPMSNGYPIDHPLSGYNANDPYKNRDPRFYATIFYNGVTVKRITNTADVMYTFETYVGGKDEAGKQKNTLTNYYIKKYIYLGWNKSDVSVQTMPKSIFFIRWTQMCLTFAEAANHVVGPTDESRFGLSAKTAIGYLRSRNTTDNIPGLGASGDPYLDACAAAGQSAFDALVKNERRIETCFEGQRFYDLRRWAGNVQELNVPVHKVVINQNNDTFTYTTEEVEKRNFSSLYMPIPYGEITRARGLVQNEGWSSWE